jgi:hypothetical protein
VLLARIGTIFPYFWLIIRPTAMPGQALPPTCTFLNVGQVCQFVFPSTCHSSDVQRILSAFVCMYCGVWKLSLLSTECCRRFWCQHILFFRFYRGSTNRIPLCMEFTVKWSQDRLRFLVATKGKCFCDIVVPKKKILFMKLFEMEA